MANLQDLYDFIDRATKSHNYPDNTGWSLKSAVKKYEVLLSEPEKESVQTFRENLDALTNKLFNKDKSMSASSLTTYKSRVLKAMGDFEKYGTDPSKMASWTVKARTRTPRQKTVVSESTDSISDAPTDAAPGMARIELPLRPGMKFILIVPPDISEHEKNTVKALLDSLNQTK
jgi:hypothetical protein